MKKICLLLQGCNCHTEDFRILIQNLKETYELTRFPTQADLIIQYFCINTSASIPEIIKEMAFLKKVKKEDAILIVCGCAVEVLGKEAFARFPYVNYVVGRENICENILKILKMKKITNKLFLEQLEQPISIKIVDGCTNHCTFCKVHYMELPLKSKSMETILETVNNLVRDGVVNIRLTGLNTTLYGVDLYGKPSLHKLLKKLCGIKGLLNINIAALATMNMYEELIYEIETNPLVGKVDLNFQSGSPHMLSVMNIHTTIENMEQMISRFRNKIRFTTFVIGHPYETSEDIDLTIDFIKRNNLWYTQLSSYQDAPGLLSNKMPQLSKKERNYCINKISAFVTEFRKEKMNQLIHSRQQAFLTDIIFYKENTIKIYLSPEEFPGEIVVNLKRDTENEILDLKYLSKCKVTISKVIDYCQLLVEGNNLEVCHEIENGGI